MRADINEQSLISANAHFWEQMLSMQLDPVPRTGHFSLKENHMLAGVGLSGAWEGRIEVRLDVGLAYKATAAMLMLPEADVQEKDMLDAIGEVANMVAGAIKSSLPRPTSMTVPTSGVEVAAFCGPETTETSLLVGFRHADGDLLVRVCEKP